MKTSPITIVLTGLLAAAAVDSAVAQGKIKDIVLTKTGRKIRGVEVTEMTTTTIRYKRGEQESELPAELLDTVTWHEPPESFIQAQAAARSGDFATAANLYAEAAEKSDREVLKLDARFLSAEALVRSAGTDQAKAEAGLAELRKYSEAAPDGYRTADVMLQMGRALLAAGKPDEAEQVLAKLASESLTKNWGAVWDARAKFEQAKAMMASGDLPGARSTFRSARQAADIASGEKPDEELEVLKAEASVGEGATFIAEEKFDDALTFFRNLAADRSTAPSIRAAAKAGEAEALYLRAVANDTSDGLRAAQLALVEATLLDGQSGPTTAKAMYYSGKVLLALGPVREASNFSTRATAYFESVVSHYPDTTWATLAGEEINR